MYHYTCTSIKDEHVPYFHLFGSTDSSMAEGDETGDLPFSSEYAKSGRASCKLCSGSIAKDALRLAIMVQSPHFDGKVLHLVS